MSTTILYAEDDDTTRQVVSGQLTDEGFEVVTAKDGQEAIAALTARTFDLVLLDIRMPRKDGLEVLEFVRSKKLKARVIMLTGVDELSIAIRAVKLGANDYMTKPFGLEDLLGAIRRVLQK
jgi:DNA-binding response OmpR family regulator